MSHSIEHDTFPEGVDKALVQKKWDRIAAAAGHQEGATSLSRDIRWLDTILGSYDEAEEFLEKHCSGKFYEQAAVRFRKMEKVPAYVTAAQAARGAAEKRYRELNAPIHYATVKSKFMACKNCGSSLAREYLRSNRCPLCSADMRPASKLAAIEKAAENVKKAETKLEEATKRAAKENKSKKLFWLVRVEYHT